MICGAPGRDINAEDSVDFRTTELTPFPETSTPAYAEPPAAHLRPHRRLVVSFRRPELLGHCCDHSSVHHKLSTFRCRISCTKGNLGASRQIHRAKPRMSPDEFIAKWRGTTRTERSAAQEHFLDVCALLGVPKPADVDRHGTEYTFEKSTRKIGDTAGFADVWKRHCFAWEYKGKRRNLVEAYAQLKQYADALENPPLLIVSDMQEIRVHTNFTNAIAQQHVIPLAELRSVEARDLLRNCFLHQERLRPTATRESVTAQAAANFANIAVLLRRHYDERRVAHFINKLVFCLFAEDIDLLPDRIFAATLEEAIKRPDDFVPMLGELFRAMVNRNGRFGMAAIPWFNGGLFDDDDVLPLGIVASPRPDDSGAAGLEGDRPDNIRDIVRERSRRQEARPDGEPVRRTGPRRSRAGTTVRALGRKPGSRDPLHRRSDNYEDHRAGRGGAVAPGMGADQGGNQGGRRAARAGAHAGRKKSCWPRRAASMASSGQASAAIASSTRPAAPAISSRCRFAPSRISIYRCSMMPPRWAFRGTIFASARKP